MYIAIKPLTVFGEEVKQGEEVKGLDQRRFNVLVEHGYIKKGRKNKKE